MKYSLSLAVISALTLAGCAEDTTGSADMPAVGSSSDLTQFQGARAGQAESGIQALGYELIRTEGLTA